MRLCIVVYEGKFEKDIEGKGCNLIEIRCKYLGVGKIIGNHPDGLRNTNIRLSQVIHCLLQCSKEATLLLDTQVR
jgi:hypothetical protein